MGRFVNPDSSAFQSALNSQIYVDKTDLIEYTNRVLNSTQAFICNSRPRRFGKSITANMLAAYYSKGCNSEELFKQLNISKRESYSKHLNQYDVIHFDVQWCMMDAGSPGKTVEYLNTNIVNELREVYPNIVPNNVATVFGALSCINATVGSKFIVIIDEWDAIIREEATNQSVQEEYIDFLRGLFKGVEPTRYLALAYLTGILPIKKIKTQSALNNFDEFTMLDASIFAPYIGFVEEEVKKLCKEYDKEFEEVKHWYDGYQLEDYHVYNPKAVVSVMLRGNYKSYWSQTGTYESILPLSSMDFDGLKAAVIEMLSGVAVPVEVSAFQNDMVSFADKDDVLTALIHLGYLGYDERRRTAFIPNEEIRQEFQLALRQNKWNEFIRFQKVSEKLLNAVLEEDAEVVAEEIEIIHNDYASTIQYNDENSLSSVLTIAFLSAMQYYFIPIREFATGRGFADFVYFPKKEYVMDYPALLVELKWNHSAKTALEQIKDKKYTQALQYYTGEILLVGINYNKKTKEHECLIERFEKDE